MIKRFALLGAALLVGLAATPGHAGTIIAGEIGLSDNNQPSVNTNNVSTATAFTVQLVTTTNQNGDFSSVPSLTAFGTKTIHTTGIDGNILPFTIGNSTFGTFTATGGSISQGGTIGSFQFANLSIVGTFSPGTIFPGLDANPHATLSLTFTQTGGKSSVGAGGSMSMAVPEPASFGLLGIGVAGLLGFRRFRARPKASA